MNSECVLWTGRITSDGYGKLGIKWAHRIAYERDIGPIPEGMEIDHLCRNRACVNPEHLEAVTHAENVRRSWPATKSHCVNGHPYTPENTYRRPTGQRDCRACIRERVRKYKVRKNLACA